MRVILPAVEVRGFETKTNKNGEQYILLRVEDTVTGKAEELIDKDMERTAFYKRGTIVDIYLEINIGKWTNIRVIDCKIKGE